MSEIKRVSVSLKVDASDELYWALILPLQQNRQLASFLVTLLQAYKDDGDVHDLVDTFANENSGVAKLRGHLETLIDLQAKATRFAEDVSDSLGGGSNESTIENFFDTEDVEEDFFGDEQGSQEVQGGQSDRTGLNDRAGQKDRTGQNDRTGQDDRKLQEVVIKPAGVVNKPADVSKKTKSNSSALAKPGEYIPSQGIIKAVLKRLDNVEDTLKVIKSVVHVQDTGVSRAVENSVENVENMSEVDDIKDTGKEPVISEVPDEVMESSDKKTEVSEVSEVPEVDNNQSAIAKQTTVVEDDSQKYLKSMMDDIFKDSGL